MYVIKYGVNFVTSSELGWKFTPLKTEAYLFHTEEMARHIASTQFAEEWDRGLLEIVPQGEEMAWKKGPLPPDTWGWGGVVEVGDESGGFYFADFCGDCVKAILSGNATVPERVLKPEKVAWYNNSLELPPTWDSKRGNAAAAIPSRKTQ